MPTKQGLMTQFGLTETGLKLAQLHAILADYTPEQQALVAEAAELLRQAGAKLTDPALENSLVGIFSMPIATDLLPPLNAIAKLSTQARRYSVRHLKGAKAFAEAIGINLDVLPTDPEELAHAQAQDAMRAQPTGATGSPSSLVN